jgi:serine/threonine-protein kinase
LKRKPDSELEVPAETAVSRPRRSGPAPSLTGSSTTQAAAPSKPPTSPGTAPPSLPTPRSRSGSASDTAIAEVVVGEETARAHGFSAVISIVALSVAPVLPLLGGDPLARLMCVTALAVMGLVSIWVWRYTGRPDRAFADLRLVHRYYGWTLAVGVLFVEYDAGGFSPVPVVLTLGIYYLGQATDRTDALAMPMFIIVSYGAFGLLLSFDLVEDRGFFNARYIDLGTRLFAVTAVCLVLSATLRMARVSRASLREAIERSNAALLLAQQREAQLAEAHHQLDRAMRVAVGKAGRYTGALAGDYRLGIVIGIGAIGEVYAAEHVTTGTPAAVKLLQAAALERDDLVERILREGAISSGLSHPHVVRVFDVGRLGDGAPYLTMELLRGRDLATRLRQEGQLSGDELVRLAREVADALQHAHDNGIVHRDLKPLNIYEATEDRTIRWKLLDFGISKLTSSGGTLTQEGVIGTPGYMSPEQARGAEVDHRSDLFSMAVVLYRAMTGQPAFPGDNTPQILFDIVYKMPKRPTVAARSLPPDVDLVMSIALAKDPAQRFQSAAEFASAFALACQRRLPPELRARGQAAVEAHPWGTTLNARSESLTQT